MSHSQQDSRRPSTKASIRDENKPIQSEANSKVQQLSKLVSNYNTKIHNSADPQEQQSLRSKRDKAYSELKKLSSEAKSHITQLSNHTYAVAPSQHSQRSSTKSERPSAHEEEHKTSTRASKENLTHFTEKPQRADDVELAFILDATNSMTPYISEAKEKMREIIKTAKDLYPHGRFRIAVIIYRDFEQGNDNTEVLQFTGSVTEVENFLAKVSVAGNYDEPEDVNGAFRKVIDELKWTSYTRVLIHIGDSPCHGSKFHDDSLPDRYEQFKTLDRDWNDIFTVLRKKGIDYHFLRLGVKTDIMINEFKKMWGSRSVVSCSKVNGGRTSSLYVHEMSMSAKQLVGQIVGSIKTSVTVSQTHLSNLNSNDLAKKFQVTSHNDMLTALTK